MGVKTFLSLSKFLSADRARDDEIFIKDKIEFVLSYITRTLYQGQTPGRFLPNNHFGEHLLSYPVYFVKTQTAL